MQIQIHIYRYKYRFPLASNAFLDSSAEIMIKPNNLLLLLVIYVICLGVSTLIWVEASFMVCFEILSPCQKLKDFIDCTCAASRDKRIYFVRNLYILTTMCFVFADSVALLEGLKTSTFGHGLDDQQHFCRQHLTMSTMSDFDGTAYICCPSRHFLSV